MKIVLYRDGEKYKTFHCEEIDIITGDGETEYDGALFLIKESPSRDGIVIDAETVMHAEFGENQVTLNQPVFVKVEEK